MLRKKSHILLIVVISVTSSVFILDACKKKDVLITTPLQFKIPAGWPQPTEYFVNNPVNEETFQIGRKLFYEGKLSKDGNFPCASCHQPFASYTTFQHDRSHGYNHSHTLRNAPGLLNVAWLNELFWDGSQDHLYVSLTHITRPDEMAENMDTVLQKLRNDTSYIRMFRAAFGDNKITGLRLLKALEQFVAFIITDNSKYDKVMRGETTFTPAEENGYTIFKSKCAVCHKEPLFTDNSFRNIGLPIDPVLKDYGRMRVTGDKNDSLKFRVPGLRNVMLTSYYAHDGRFSDVGQMLLHYAGGVQHGPTLDPLLVNGIPLTANEMSYLISFMSALTDASVTTNPRFLKP
ncbi:MAG: cytochrome peroxidase [Chitinophagaceae bacterium]|nr:cytochrome peroxidase [Chitinophagaceae bacterium]